MAKRVSRATGKELVRETGIRYREAGRADKGRILDEFVAVTGYHRKHALRLLNHAAAEGGKPGQSRSRIYDAAVREALTVLWEATDRICGKRLKALLPTLVESLERHGHLHLGPELRARVLAISPATIDRLLAEPRAHVRGRRRRRSSGLLRSQIPVRTFADWGDPGPGYMEVDLVAHNGGNGAGSFVHTLVLTDVASGWTECIPLLVREQGLVVEGVRVVRTRLPFALLGVDTDNDGAFVNESLLNYAKAEGLVLTRSRAYRKNDQAYVEQKNGAVVRRLVGYARFEGVQAAQTLARLYSVARLFVNCFQPSFKLKQKQRQGAKVTKQYHAPVTPCDRLLACEALSEERKQGLVGLRSPLDPLRLLQQLRAEQAALAHLSGLAAGEGRAAPDESLARFLVQLSTLWKGGEARPTHQQPDRPPRHWRTRVDPLASVWTEVEAWLAAEPELTAKALFSRLQAAHPGAFSPGQLRTLQRRVREWRQVMARRLIFGGGEQPPDGGRSVPGDPGLVSDRRLALAADTHFRVPGTA